jgi:hypothetical protein
MEDYREFASNHFQRTGFTPNMPVLTYYVPQDRSSLLSYTYDRPVMTIDPVNAPYSADNLSQWLDFLNELNDWAAARGGFAMLNQSSLIRREHIVGPYGARLDEFNQRLLEVDQSGRFMNSYFAGLLGR